MNPWAGEVEVFLDGKPHKARLTLAALAELEAEIGAESLVDLAARFESGAVRGRDVLAVLLAGLRGAGFQGGSQDLIAVELEASPVLAAQKAAALLLRAFSLPEAGS